MTVGNPWALLLVGLAPALIAISRGQLIHLSPARRGAAIALRLVLLALLVLALADARQLKRSTNLSVVFLLDHSDSMPRQARDTALNFIRAAAGQMPPDDTAGVVVFGANAVVEEAPRRNLQPAAIDSVPGSGYTNFADAIRLGMALFPPDAPKRLVLLSDGQNNLGDPKAAARLAAAAGIELDTVSIAAPAGPEVRLTGLDVPGTLHQREHFDLALTVDSTTATRAGVQLFADGKLIAAEEVNIQPGANRFVFPMVAGEEGFSTFRARLVPAEDTQTQNNRLDAFSLIEGPLRALLVAAAPEEAANLLPALKAAGLQPVPVAPSQLPATPLGLSEYAVVVLVNIPAARLSPAQLEVLQVYVRDLGGGLVAVGGPESYGAGGYFQTPLEETLPVDMALKDRERLPGMSMLMVIDKSGSMSSAGTQGMGGPRKVELAKEAIYRAVDLLAPWDRVGVIAFDNAARWVMRPVPVVDVPGIKGAVGTIRAGGGTDILAGLKVAADAMPAEPSRIKHIILLTDGGANPAGIPELVDALAEQDVSVSVVAIGDDYAPFLEDVARRGNGRFHFARDAATIPQIFAQEAALALKAYLIEEEFAPRLTAASPILQGITALPNLLGYVATEPKLTAQTVLVSHNDDPVLAQWQYGLGRAVAFTSDATGRWGKLWVGWDGFARFWGQAVRWTIVEGATGNLETRVTFDPTLGATRLTVEALDSRGNFINNLNLQGSLVSPGLEQEPVSLEQVAPGLYQTDIHPDETGAYLLRVVGAGEGEQIAGSATRGFVVSYSPEYAAQPADPALMAGLAELGGGQTLSLNNPAAVFAHTLPPVGASSPLWPLLLAAFVLILPFDVGLRRVIIGREEVLKLAARLRRALPHRAAGAPASPAAPSSARSLLSIKEPRPQTPPSSRASRPISGQPPPVTPPPDLSPAPPPEPEPHPPAEDRMSRLLNAKRQAKK